MTKTRSLHGPSFNLIFAREFDKWTFGADLRPPLNTHVDYFPDGLALVSSAPPQTPGEVIPSAQGDHNHARRLDERRLV